MTKAQLHQLAKPIVERFTAALVELLHKHGERALADARAMALLHLELEFERMTKPGLSAGSAASLPAPIAESSIAPADEPQEPALIPDVASDDHEDDDLVVDDSTPGVLIVTEKPARQVKCGECGELGHNARRHKHDVAAEAEVEQLPDLVPLIEIVDFQPPPPCCSSGSRRRSGDHAYSRSPGRPSQRRGGRRRSTDTTRSWTSTRSSWCGGD